MEYLTPLQIIWDYLCLRQPPRKKGWQLPQPIPESAWEAFRQLVTLGYDKQLAK